METIKIELLHDTVNSFYGIRKYVYRLSQFTITGEQLHDKKKKSL